jgi:predicted nucleic acid-binding protein
MMRGFLDPDTSGLRAYDWCVSWITIGELTTGAALAKWDLRKWTDIADWLGRTRIVPSDLRVSYTWGQLAATAQQRGRRSPVNDMWMPAVAITHGMPLATREREGLRGLRGAPRARAVTDWASRRVRAFSASRSVDAVSHRTMRSTPAVARAAHRALTWGRALWTVSTRNARSAGLEPATS